MTRSRLHEVAPPTPDPVTPTAIEEVRICQGVAATGSIAHLSSPIAQRKAALRPYRASR